MPNTSTNVIKTITKLKLDDLKQSDPTVDLCKQPNANYSFLPQDFKSINDEILFREVAYQIETNFKWINLDLPRNLTETEKKFLYYLIKNISSEGDVKIAKTVKTFNFDIKLKKIYTLNLYTFDEQTYLLSNS